MNDSGWRKIGQVSVDSGTLMLADPCYLVGNDFKHSDYEKIVDSDFGNYYQRGDAHCDSLGLVFSTLTGDGVYPVEGKFNASDQLIEVRIRF